MRRKLRKLLGLAGGARIRRIVGRVETLVAELQRGIAESQAEDMRLDAEVVRIVDERATLREGRDQARRLITHLQDAI
jgi:hypothetical protein